MSACNCKMERPKGRKPRDNSCSGHANTQEYKIWSGIRSRCRDSSKNKTAQNYRKVKFSVDWSKDFRNFLRDMGKRPSKRHSVDRIDSSRGYCKHNCRWATPHEQILNRKIVKNKNMLLGVFRHGASFCLRRSFRGKEYWIGAFDTLEEAAYISSRIIPD